MARVSERRFVSSLRWFLPAAALVLLTGCAASTEADASSDYQAFPCIQPNRVGAQYAPPSAGPQRISVIGDSLTNGSPQGGTGSGRWTAVVEQELRSRGLDVVVNFGAEGGSGYVSQGNRGGVFADKISSTVKPDDRIVVFFGSRNDSRARVGERCGRPRSRLPVHSCSSSDPWANFRKRLDR